jgi:hypothetical protein
MPNANQMREVIGRIEREGTEAFSAIAWNGFSEAQERDVERRVVSVQSSDFWMDGVSYHQVIDASARGVTERHRGMTR